MSTLRPLRRLLESSHEKEGGSLSRERHVAFWIDRAEPKRSVEARDSTFLFPGVDKRPSAARVDKKGVRIETYRPVGELYRLRMLSCVDRKAPSSRGERHPVVRVGGNGAARRLTAFLCYGFDILAPTTIIQAADTIR